MTTEERCDHGMIVGTCGDCRAKAARAAKPAGELVLLSDPDNPDNHRVHEPGCYWATHAQDGVEVPWPRTPITRMQAAGMKPCQHCQPSLPKAAPDAVFSRSAPPLVIPLAQVPKKPRP